MRHYRQDGDLGTWMFRGIAFSETSSVFGTQTKLDCVNRKNRKHTPVRTGSISERKSQTQTGSPKS